jgi:hypothetical protein
MTRATGNLILTSFSLKMRGEPTTGVGEDAGKKEPSYTVGGNVD